MKKTEMKAAKKHMSSLWSVILPAGRHEMVFSFIPQGLYTGVIVSALSLLILIILIYFYPARFSS